MNRLKALNTKLLINRSIGTKTKRSKKLYNETVVYNDTIDATKTIIKKSLVPRHKIPLDDLVFGKYFSDHMLEIDWDRETGWHVPIIKPYENFSISPAAAALHYGIECFEGMKAYKDKKGNVRLFRPDCNMERLNKSMVRLAMPSFNADGLLGAIEQLLKIDESWVPTKDGYSLYLRPTAIGTSPTLGVKASDQIKLYVICSPVGPYFKDGFKPVKLYADSENVRAWPGGVGSAKVGGNYGPCIAPAEKAAKLGCQQILWLFGEDHQITEVGAMNIFFVIKNKNGDIELTTAPLDRGDILHGVTRRSIIELAKEELKDIKVTERWLTMQEVIDAEKEGRLLEAFGAGTAAIISPVNGIVYKDHDIKIPTGDDAGPLAKKLWSSLLAIQSGRVNHPWSVPIK